MSAAGWTCPECGSKEFSLTTYERVTWSVSEGNLNLEECEGGTNLVGYSDAWECANCDWRGETPPWEEAT